MPDDKEDNDNNDERKMQRLESLLDGLLELGAADEPLVDRAFTLALEATGSASHMRTLAEALHKKWLSNQDFPPVAVRVCKKLADLRAEDLRFRSIIYGIVLNDYKDRHSLRKISRTLFCNSVHFAFEFFRSFHLREGGEATSQQRRRARRRLSNVLGGGGSAAVSVSLSSSTYTGLALGDSRLTVKSGESPRRTSMTAADRGQVKGRASGEGQRADEQQDEEQVGGVSAPPARQISALKSVGALGAETDLYVDLVDCLFDYLQILIDDMATESEMILFHYLMFLVGPYLERRRASKIQHIMMTVRRNVIDNDLRPQTRALMMELIELQGHEWKTKLLPTSIVDFYFKYRPAHYDIERATHEVSSDEDSDDSFYFTR